MRKKPCSVGRPSESCFRSRSSPTTQPTLHDERFQIEQATFAPDDPIRSRHSPGFSAEWEPELARIARDFGSPPDDIDCPEALFSCRFGDRHVAVVRASNTTGRWRFHFLILGAELYAFIGEPFAPAEQFPAIWSDGADLTSLHWPEDEDVPPRSVESLQQILKEGDSPLLLGTTQVLVDGGRIVLERPEPAPRFARDVWMLLPHSIRAESYPATFAFSTALDVHLIVMPVKRVTDRRYLDEEQALNYPDSRYERHLQIAIEAGDQVGINRLFTRRSSGQTLRLAMMLVVGFLLLSLVMRLL